jgi:hypothetical protein
MVGNLFVTLALRVSISTKITPFLNAILGVKLSKHGFHSCIDSGLTLHYSQRVPFSTHHPKERLIGEICILIDGRKHTED